MTDSLEDPKRRKFLKTLGAAGATAGLAGCSTLHGLREDAEGIAGGGNTPIPPPEETPTTTETTTTEETTETTTETETETTTPEPENTFEELDRVINNVKNDPGLKQDLGVNFADDSFELRKEMIKERDIESVENWGLYAQVRVTDANNWDDLDGIYNNEEGREQLENLLSSRSWDIFQTIDRYGRNLINRDRVNLDSVNEVGIVFYDDEGETAGYVADSEDLDEMYSADSLESSYHSHFEENFGLYPLEEKEEGN